MNRISESIKDARSYLYPHYKKFTDDDEAFLQFIVRYIENEHYLEITNELFHDTCVLKGDVNFMENCPAQEFSKNSNPSTLFSEESSNGESSSSNMSNSSEIISIIDATLKSNNINKTKKELLQILKDFYIFVNNWFQVTPATPVIEGLLGRIWELGLFGFEKDPKLAYQNYHTSSMQNYPYGIYNFARCHEFAIGIEKASQTAIDLYRSVAKLGYAKGLYRFALICLKNNDVPMGMNYMRQAMLAKEKEIKKLEKSKESIFYNFKSAYLTNCPYFYHYGTLYMIDHSQLVRDTTYAFEIFLRGAKLGCKHSMYMAAEFYEKGTTVAKDMVQANKYYAEAAALGQSDAQAKVGKMLVRKFTGENSNPDKGNVGLSLLEQSAFSGNTKGMMYLAETFYMGITGEREVLQALWWYQIAESLGEDVGLEIQKAENYIKHNKHAGF